MDADIKSQQEADGEFLLESHRLNPTYSLSEVHDILLGVKERPSIWREAGIGYGRFHGKRVFDEDGA